MSRELWAIITGPTMLEVVARQPPIMLPPPIVDADPDKVAVMVLLLRDGFDVNERDPR